MLRYKLGFCVLILLGAYSPSFARPSADDNPSFRQFFESLLLPGGRSCCGEADCKPVLSQSPKNSPTHHWRVWIAKKDFGPSAPDNWVDWPHSVPEVDSASTLPRPSRAIACWSFGYWDLEGYSDHPHLICFRPPQSEM